MKVNSIGTTYQTYQTYQNRRKQNINGVKNYTNRDTVSFQGKHSCAKLFTVLLGGIGAIGSYGLSVFSGTNSIQPQFFAIVCGIAGALYGFDRGNYLDEIINDSEDTKNPVTGAHDGRIKVNRHNSNSKNNKII